MVITDAEVHPDLKDFVVESVGQSSRATGASLRPPLPDEVASRIGVREKQVLRLVEHEIACILERSARVPLQNVGACRDALVERMRDRLLGRCAARVDRAELEDLIAQHGGFPPSVSSTFVPPARFDEIRLRLERPPHALVLVGAPGIGKTEMAEEIARLHRRADRPFEILKDPRPDEIRAALLRAGQTLFYLEDPWGRYKLAEDAATWTDELARLIQGARGNPDKRFLVTSRTGLLRESVDLSARGSDLARVQRTLGAVVVPLLEADFDEPARSKIVNQWMRGAARWKRDWVDDRIREVVSTLTVPQALTAFAHAVLSAERAEDLRLEQLLAESQVAAIGGVVRHQVLQLNELPAAVAIWVFLASGELLTDEVVRTLTLWLGEEWSGADLSRLCAHLTSNGWIFARGGVFVAHSTVIEGLERLVVEKHAASGPVIKALLAMLVRECRVELAARLLKGLCGRNLPVPSEVRVAIDSHLRDATASAGDAQLAAAIDSVARLSEATDPVSLLARALGTRTGQSGFDSWSLPAWTPEQRTLVRSSPDAERLARRYVRACLTRDSSLFGEEQRAEFLRSISWDLSGEFTDAAVRALERGGGAEGALHGALGVEDPAWDRLLDAAMVDYDATERWFSEEGAQEQRRAKEGEFGAEYSTHVLDEPSERFHSSTSAFEKIVSARRERCGYEWLVAHPRRESLVRAWAKAIPDDSGEAHAVELQAILDASESWNRRDVLEAIGRARCVTLVTRLLTALGSGTIAELSSVWGALFGTFEPDAVVAAVQPALSSVAWNRRAAAVYEVRGARMPDRHDFVDRNVEDYKSRIRDLLRPAEREALEACANALGSDDDSQSALDAETLNAVEALVDGPHDLLVAGASLVLAIHGRTSQEASVRMAQSSDDMIRLHGLRVVSKTQPLDRATFREALSDPYYQCRRFAMYVLSLEATAEDRTSIFAMLGDASAPVREACANVVGERRWVDGADALCGLLTDRRDLNQSSFQFEMPDCHVARAASRALLRLPPPLAPQVVARLFEFLLGGQKSSEDLVVHGRVLRVVSRERDAQLGGLIARLLRSSRRVGDEESGTFPLRFDAAWSWVEHLLAHPDDAAQNVAEFAEAAEHTDDRLAAPALLVLGMASRHSGDQLRRVFANPALSDEHVLLVEIGARAAGARVSEDLIGGRLPRTHPGRRFLEMCSDTAGTDDDWRASVFADAEITAWIELVSSRSPVNAAIRRSLLRSPRSGALTMLNDDDFRTGEVKRGIPVLSTFQLVGLE